MVAEPLTIEVEPDSDLARALAESNGRPVRLVSNGVRFRVSRDEEASWAGYDLAALRGDRRDPDAGGRRTADGARFPQP